MTNKACPVCGSSEVRSSQENRSVAAPLGPSVEYLALVDSCSNCGEVGDFDAANDERIEDALRKSEISSVRAMLDELVASGISNASLERALRLPQRTTSRWKDGKVSAGAAALLRMVRTYPWLVEVADDGFEPRSAIFAVVREAGRYVASAIAAQLQAVRSIPGATTTGIAIQITAFHSSMSGGELRSPQMIRASTSPVGIQEVTARAVPS